VSPNPQLQPVLEAMPNDEAERATNAGVWRRAIAGPAGLALLLAGGGMMVRVLLLTFQQQGVALHYAFYTGVACVLAGVALLLIALPKIVSGAERVGGDTEPTPETG
jgi:ferric-dicitrate binding protein FerR (iron transport regulator)